LKERPAATIAQRIGFLQSITGERLSYSTIRRLLKRMGWSRKKGVWVQHNETSGSEPLGR
jgi:transposase